MGKQRKQWETLFLGAPKSLQMVTAAMKLKDAVPLKKSYDQPRQHIKKQRHYVADKGPSSQSNGFSSSHVWVWELDYKESWALKNWCFWAVVLERLLRVPSIARRSNQSILKEISPEYSLEGLMLKPKLQYFGYILWRTDSLEKTWMQEEKGNDWRQEEKGTTQDERVEWHHQLNGHEFKQAPRVGDGQGSLACCRPWGHKESDTSEWLN